MIPRQCISVLAAVGLVLGMSAPSVAQDKILRVGMTASDIPKTHGQPDQAFEGNRLTGLTLYDALTSWDYVTGTRIMPTLATEWAVEPDDHTKWIFKLHPGITFRDGSPFNADAVV